jgi:hypothetical protein
VSSLKKLPDALLNSTTAHLSPLTAHSSEVFVFDLFRESGFVAGVGIASATLDIVGLPTSEAGARARDEGGQTRKAG